MNSENYFRLIQQAKCLARVSYISFIRNNKPDLPSSIFSWLFEKSIDLVDGIIKLHESNLDECSQSLIRVLFETYLKYIHVHNLMTKISKEEVAIFVLESIVLLREKSTLQQDKVFPCGNLTEHLGDINDLKNKYNDDNNPFIITLKENHFLGKGSCLDSMKKHSFLLNSIEQISIKYAKTCEYQMLYRNFSRNIHANDLIEYLLKQGHNDKENYIESRNIATFGLVFRIFLEITAHMDYLFSLGISEQLVEITEEFNNL